MTDIHDRAVDLVRGGMTYKAAAEAIGTTIGVVAGACKRAGLRIGRRPPKPRAYVAAEPRPKQRTRLPPLLRREQSRKTEVRSAIARETVRRRHVPVTLPRVGLLETEEG